MRLHQVKLHNDTGGAVAVTAGLEARLCSLWAHPPWGGSEVKASASNARDPGSILASGRSPGEGNGNALQYSCLEDPMDKRSLVGYSPQGCKESDTTERLLNFPCGYFYAVCC